MVGVHYASLHPYAEVRTLMTQAANEDKPQLQHRRFHAREEELTQQVTATLQQLRETNRRITKRAIEKVMHVSDIWAYYPKVKALIESAIQAQRSTNETAIAS